MMILAVIGTIALSGCGPTDPRIDESRFRLVDEVVDDLPLKTQIEQHIVATLPTNQGQIESELLARFQTLKERTGFRHHRHPTNIYLYIYETEEQARAGQGLWLAMLSYRTPREPSVQISQARIDALGNPPEARLGMTEANRRSLWREMVQLEERAESEARRRIPDTRILEQGELQVRLAEQYRDELATAHGLSRDDLTSIMVEAFNEGWVEQ